MVEATKCGEWSAARRCLALSFGLLCLAATLALVAMLHLHVGLHCGHACHHESVSMAGQAHPVVFADVVVQCLIVRALKGAQRAEVGINQTTLQ